MALGVMGCRVMPKWSRSAPVAAVKGHCLGSATRPYTKSSSAGPRSSCFATILTPLQHPQNTMVLLKIFRSNKYHAYEEIYNAAWYKHQVVVAMGHSRYWEGETRALTLINTVRGHLPPSHHQALPAWWWSGCDTATFTNIFSRALSTSVQFLVSPPREGVWSTIFFALFQCRC
jgi:hypothetical protein